eukprot:TRINITY_DN1353_c0_g2_i3.p1 TRINITY_DN1353_c0_g2~~TRINITY_DN1353_c0_g2_i3.p1  ORF type:complete len:148 (-),score=39.70 TRINITY_DN1353_c0_g2_i3:128-571(-)
MVAPMIASVVLRLSVIVAAGATDAHVAGTTAKQVVDSARMATPALPNSMGLHELDLHAEMRRMMQDDEDENLELGRKTGFLQQSAANAVSSDDVYLEESAMALSTALGPRWEVKKLNDDAENGRQALLRGISGGKVLGMLNAVTNMR